MNGFLRIIFLMLVVIYVISPIDVVPGPIDDVLLLLVTVASNYKRKVIED